MQIEVLNGPDEQENRKIDAEFYDGWVNNS